MHETKQSPNNVDIKTIFTQINPNQSDPYDAQDMIGAPTPNTYFHTDKARVLLIEDDRTTRKIAAACLENECTLVEASSVSEGITEFNTSDPDLVFLDIGLPDGDGQDLLEWIMRNDPGAYVVMFSGLSDSNHVFDAMEAGARGFISKPFDAKQMLYHLWHCPKLHT